MKIVAGTTSALKIRAIESALAGLGIAGQVEGFDVASGVSNQPFGFDQIMEGSKNRAVQAQALSDAEMAVGIEYGLVQIGDEYFDIPCVTVITPEGLQSVSFGAGMYVPGWIIEKIKAEDSEFGPIIQEISGGGEKDPIKYFSGDKIKREDILAQAVAVALSQIINVDKYEKR